MSINLMSAIFRTYGKIVPSRSCRTAPYNFELRLSCCAASHKTGVFYAEETMKSKRYSIPESRLKEVIEKSKGICFYCGIELPEDTYYYDDNGNMVSSRRNWHVDHVIPICKGGGYNIENLVASCSSCNHTKGGQ